MPPNAMVDMCVAGRPSVAPLRAEQKRDVSYHHGGENCPAGQAYYEVVVVEVNPECDLYTECKVTMVIFCKEQILNREEHQNKPIIGWPTGAIRIRPSNATADDPVDAGVWSTMTDEVNHCWGSSGQGTINEESPGVTAQGGDVAAPSASPSAASGTYTAATDSMPPEPPLPSVPGTSLRQQAVTENPQHPS